MSDPKLKIIIIDNTMNETEPLIVELRLTFKDSNIILRKNATDGLQYIMDNLNSKMIVLLDYDLGAGEPTGTDIFLQIREKTALLYVIIITAKLIDEVPNKELAAYINKDALAFVDKTVSVKDRINIVKNAVHSLDTKVDCILEQWIYNHSEKEQNEPYLTTSSGKTHSLLSILEEIRQRTDFGKTIERNILLLAVDLLTRGKKQIND